MSGLDVIDLLWKSGIGLFVGLVLYAVKDWRRTRLENELAEETLGPKAKKAGIEALETQILAMSSAWDHERESKNRQIKDLETELTRSKERLLYTEGQLDSTKERLQSIQEEMDMLKREVRGLLNGRESS